MFNYKAAVANVATRLGPVASSTVRFLRQRDRLGTVARFMDEWTYVNHDHLPEKFFLELFPDLRGERVAITPDIGHHFELPYGERFVLAALIEHLKPEVLFEFGTFTGATTKLLADRAGNRAVVHTIDLPEEELVSRPKHAEAIGRNFTGHHLGDYVGRIVSHRCDTRNFDYSQFAGRVDFSYVDASHEYSDVMHDSYRAMDMRSDRGIIVWDDYQSSCLGVVRALTELGRKITIVRIAGTRLAIHSREWEQNDAYFETDRVNGYAHASW